MVKARPAATSTRAISFRAPSTLVPRRWCRTRRRSTVGLRTSTARIRRAKVSGVPAQRGRWRQQLALPTRRRSGSAGHCRPFSALGVTVFSSTSAPYLCRVPLCVIGDRLSAGYVVADPLHFLVVGAPATEAPVADHWLRPRTAPEANQRAARRRRIDREAGGHRHQIGSADCSPMESCVLAQDRMTKSVIMWSDSQCGACTACNLPSDTESYAQRKLTLERPDDNDCFRCSDRHRRHRHILGDHCSSIATVPTRTGDDGRHRAGIRLVDHRDRGGARLVDHACSPTHVVIAASAPVGSHRQGEPHGMRCTGVDETPGIAAMSSTPAALRTAMPIREVTQPRLQRIGG
jgi:hypothetical protein